MPRHNLIASTSTTPHTPTTSEAPASLHPLNLYDTDTSFNHPRHVRCAHLVAPPPNHQPQCERPHLILASFGKQESGRAKVHDPQQHQRSKGERTRYARYFLNFIIFYLITIYLQDRDTMRGGKPLPVVFSSTQSQQEGVYPPSTVSPSTQTRQERRIPLLSCFCHVQMRREGGNPLLSCFLHTQMRQEGVSPFPSCSFSRRHDERGFPPSSSRFFPHRREEEGFPPSPSYLLSHRHNEKGFPLLGRVSFHTNATRGKFFPLVVLYLFK